MTERSLHKIPLLPVRKKDLTVSRTSTWGKSVLVTLVSTNYNPGHVQIMDLCFQCWIFARLQQCKHNFPENLGTINMGCQKLILQDFGYEIPYIPLTHPIDFRL